MFNLLVPLALPQTATIPFNLVCEIAFAKIFPPTVSTTPSQVPLPINLGSPSNSLRSNTVFALILLNSQLFQAFL